VNEKTTRSREIQSPSLDKKKAKTQSTTKKKTARKAKLSYIAADTNREKPETSAPNTKNKETGSNHLLRQSMIPQTIRNTSTGKIFLFLTTISKR
jgi:hypothetical protein